MALQGMAALWKTDPARARELCSKGGKAAHDKGTAHRWTSAEAKVAGRKGGSAPKRPKPVVAS